MLLAAHITVRVGDDGFRVDLVHDAVEPLGLSAGSYWWEGNDLKQLNGLAAIALDRLEQAALTRYATH
jgi:glyoxylase-like metal-dependent hydrolase (beta-lactamase superfamily II)